MILAKRVGAALLGLALVFSASQAFAVTVSVPPGNMSVTQAVIAVNPDGTAGSLSTQVYPLNSTALTSASGNKANATATATLTGTSTTTVYISGFEMTASGATAALPVTCTVTGILGGTLSYTFDYASGVLVSSPPLVVEYNPPLPASAVNTAIVVSCPASGSGGTNAAMVAHGFYQ